MPKHSYVLSSGIRSHVKLAGQASSLKAIIRNAFCSAVFISQL